MGNHDNVPAAERDYSWREGLDPDVESAKRRLEVLLDLNSEISGPDQPALSPEAAAFRNPVEIKKACSLLGLCLGIIPPISFFARILVEKPTPNDAFFVLLASGLVAAVSGTTGFFTGKVAGKLLALLERCSWLEMILSLTFVGILWGIIAGAAGGIIFLILGAIPGAVIGGAVGAVTLPIFGILHRLLSRNGLIERDKLLPVAIGISSLAAGLMLGFPGF